jgi:hypothetical protein
MEDYVVSIFDFTDKFLASDGAILFFHPDDVLKEIRSYMKSYSFQIQMKWAIFNSFPLISLEDPSMKVWTLSLVSNFLHVSSSQIP